MSHEKRDEQADLLQVLYGRNGECPLPVIAASSPSDCFNAIIEAFTIATSLSARNCSHFAEIFCPFATCSSSFGHPAFNAALVF